MVDSSISAQELQPGRPIGYGLLVSALLDALAAVSSPDDGGTRDVAWLRGYVAGIANAASIAMELDEAVRDDAGEEA